MEKKELCEIFIAGITKARRDILDILEIAFRDHKDWKYVRSRVLRALGESGLEGQIQNIMKNIHEDGISSLEDG